MEQGTREQYTVNGYLFGDVEDVKLAHQEQSAIQYMEKKMERYNGEAILAVYQATLEKKLFRTPIGYNYLQQLQKKMLSLGVAKDKIPPIPLYQVYNNNYKTKEPPVRKPIKKKVEPQVKKLRYSMLGNFILIVLVILLFAITLTGENANAINYRNAITNEYSAWEQELTERENAVREKERELGISSY